MTIQEPEPEPEPKLHKDTEGNGGAIVGFIEIALVVAIVGTLVFIVGRLAGVL